MMMMRNRYRLMAHPSLFIQLTVHTIPLSHDTETHSRISLSTDRLLPSSRRPTSHRPMNTFGQKLWCGGNISRLIRVCYEDGVALGQDRADGGVRGVDGVPPRLARCDHGLG